MSNMTEGDPTVIEEHAPGKLYVGGEYAVVEPGHPAVLIAVDRLLTVRVAPGDPDAREGRIRSERYPNGAMTWTRRGDAVTFAAVPPSAVPGPEDGKRTVIDRRTLAIVDIVDRLMRELGTRSRLADIHITSELDDPSGRKYGLGSSAAVTIALIRALLRLNGLQLNTVQEYKLAMLASSAVQAMGSGGDLAASAFGGCVRFTAPDRRWLARQRRIRTIGELIDMPWPEFSVRRLELPARWRFLVGWTGSPASTPHLVGGVRSRVSAEDYRYFCEQSDSCVDGLVDAIGRTDLSAAFALIRRARALLTDLAERSSTPIETPLLTRLIATAERWGAAAKSSGAGGGDCGIALTGPLTNVPNILANWRHDGILPLDLHVYDSHGFVREEATARTLRNPSRSLQAQRIVQ